MDEAGIETRVAAALPRPTPPRDIHVDADGSQTVAPDEALFVSLYPHLRRFAAVTAGARTDPDDIVQEAMARVLQRQRLADLEQPLAYIRSTILNIVRNDHRRRTREASAYSRVHATDRERDHVEASERDDVDLTILDAVTPETRALIYLVDVEGLATADAAALTGLSPMAARARLSRGRRTLRQRLAEHTKEGTR